MVKVSGTDCLKTHKSSDGCSEQTQSVQDQKGTQVAEFTMDEWSVYNAWGGNMTHGLHSHHAWSVGGGEVTVKKSSNHGASPNQCDCKVCKSPAHGRTVHGFLGTGRVFAMNGVEIQHVAFIPAMHGQWAVGRSPF